MKKILLPLVLLIYSLGTLSGQNIILNTQGDVNTIGPTLIGAIGDLSIHYDVPINPITDLSLLSGISSVNTLNIYSNEFLPSLNGLDNLTSINGDLLIHNNPALTDISALDQINTVENLEVLGNVSLANLSGLDGLFQIHGSLYIGGNDVLTDMSALQNLNIIKGALKVSFNKKLKDLSGLEGVSLIGTDPNLPTSGLFEILFNDLLEDINAVENLSGVNRVWIQGNPELCNCEVVLTMDDYTLSNFITMNKTGCNSLQEIDQGLGCPQCDNSIAEGEILFPCTGEAVVGLKVDLSGANMATTMTDGDGKYSFEIPNTGEIRIQPEQSNNSPLCGVSTYDLILMALHIEDVNAGITAGINILETYPRIAADIDQDNIITYDDLIELRKLLLFIITDFEEVTSWVTVYPLSFENNGPTNPPFYDDFILYNNTEEVQCNHDFMALKMGDLNCSISQSGTQNPDGLVSCPELKIAEGGKGGRENTKFIIQDQSLKAKQIYQIPVYSPNFDARNAFEFGLESDYGALEIMGIQSSQLPNMNKQNYSRQKNLFNAIWFDTKPLSLGPDQPIFYLQVQAKKDLASLQGLVDLRVGGLNNVSYDKKGSASSIELSFSRGKEDKGYTEKRLSGKTTSGVSGVSLAPNPFYGNTTLTFIADTVQPVFLHLLNATGQRVLEESFSAELGRNVHAINMAEMLPGVYYYQLQHSGKESSTGTIIKF